MKFATVCSGIGAPEVAWKPLGWQPVFCSEIESFPNAVLQERHGIPNLGDMNKFKEWPNERTIDLICAGCPCQAFSIAGLRKGLDDPRGNLTLIFLGILEKYRPRWVIYENVPGILSDSTNAMNIFLDSLEELGYIIDIDIIDAQYNGIPQRRRRVFVCGERADVLLKTMTISSVLIIIKCLQEIFLSLLGSQFKVLEGEQIESGLVSLSKDGAKKRMILLETHGVINNLCSFISFLEETERRHSIEQKNLVASLGGKAAECTQEEKLTDLKMGGQYLHIGESLKIFLEESLKVAKLYTTSMEINQITPFQIYMCSQTVLSIARHIPLLNQLSPYFYGAASSSLIALKGYIKYARFTSSDLFGDTERIHEWFSFIEQAEQTSYIIGNIGIECFEKILPISKSLQGNTPPSREKGSGFAFEWWRAGRYCL
jgi:DNA-cytosine methyltransferase